MGVIIDEVDGEMEDQATAPPPAAQVGAQADSPESDMAELERKMTVLRRHRDRLHAD